MCPAWILPNLQDGDMSPVETLKLTVAMCPLGPHSHILVTGGGGFDRGSYCKPKKSQLQNLSTQKNHYFFSIPKKNPLVFFSQPQKIPVFFWQPPKIPASFIDPERSLLAKISHPKKSLPPPRH